MIVSHSTLQRTKSALETRIRTLAKELEHWQSELRKVDRKLKSAKTVEKPRKQGPKLV